MIKKKTVEAFLEGAWVPAEEAHKVCPMGLDRHGIPLTYRMVEEERPVLTLLLILLVVVIVFGIIGLSAWELHMLGILV
ncbi:MAG: hypothetical protein MJ117_00395 [Lachnospiraceae bacterium]|nr:hypothetical protein [Lachnospiraceae bacterium]